MTPRVDDIWNCIIPLSSVKPLTAELGLTATSTDVLYSSLENAGNKQLHSSEMQLPSLFPAHFPIAVTPYVPSAPRLEEQKAVEIAVESPLEDLCSKRTTHEDEREHKIRIVEKLGSVHHAMAVADAQQTSPVHHVVVGGFSSITWLDDTSLCDLTMEDLERTSEQLIMAVINDLVEVQQFYSHAHSFDSSVPIYVYLYIIYISIRSPHRLYKIYLIL